MAVVDALRRGRFPLSGFVDLVLRSPACKRSPFPVVTCVMQEQWLTDEEQTPGCVPALGQGTKHSSLLFPNLFR